MYEFVEVHHLQAGRVDTTILPKFFSVVLTACQCLAYMVWLIRDKLYKHAKMVNQSLILL